MPNEKIKILYDAVSKDYDVGGYAEFESKMQDPSKRQAFYNGVGKEYELGTYDEFESKLGVKKKEPTPTPSSNGQNPSQTQSGGINETFSKAMKVFTGNQPTPTEQPKKNYVEVPKADVFQTILADKKKPQTTFEAIAPQQEPLQQPPVAEKLNPQVKTYQPTEEESYTEAAKLNQKIISDTYKLIGDDEKLKKQENNIARGLYDLYKSNPKEYENILASALKREGTAATQYILSAGLLPSGSPLEYNEEAALSSMSEAEKKVATLANKGLELKYNEVNSEMRKQRSQGYEQAYNDYSAALDKAKSLKVKIDSLRGQIDKMQLPKEDADLYSKLSAEYQQTEQQILPLKQKHEEISKQVEQLNSANIPQEQKQAMYNQISGSYRQVADSYNAGVKKLNELRSQMQPIVQKQQRMVADANPNGVDLMGSYQRAVEEYNTILEGASKIPKEKVEGWYGTMKKAGNVFAENEDMAKAFPNLYEQQKRALQKQKEFEDLGVMAKIGITAKDMALGVVKGTVNNLILQPMLSVGRFLDTTDKYTSLDSFLEAFSNTAKGITGSNQPKRFDSGEYNWWSVPESLGEMGGFMVALGLGGGGNVANARAMATSFLATKNSYFEEAKAEGLSDNEANGYSSEAAALTSMLELVNPEIPAAGIFNGRTAKYWAEAAKNGKNPWKEIAKGVGKETVGENAQEILQLLGDKLVQSGYNTDSKKVFDNDIKGSEIMETMGLTTALTVLTGGLAGTKKALEFRDNPEWLTYAAQNYSNFKDAAAAEVASGKISRSDYESMMKAVEDARAIYESMPKEVQSSDALMPVMKLLNERKQQEFIVNDETKSEVFKKEAKEKIKNIDGEILKLTQPKENISETAKPEAVTTEGETVNQEGETQNAIKERNLEQNISVQREGNSEKLREEGVDRNVAPEDQEGGNQTGGGNQLRPETPITEEEIISTQPINNTQNEKENGIQKGGENGNEVVSEGLQEGGEKRRQNVNVSKSTAQEEKVTPESESGGVKAPETEKVEVIRKLGTGDNVYFETDKLRVNDYKNGNVVLNINSKEFSPFPMANIQFDNVGEAVMVAKKLNEIYPNGVPDAVLIEKVVESLRKDINTYEKKEDSEKINKMLQKEKRSESAKKSRRERIDKIVKSVEPESIQDHIAASILKGTRFTKESLVDMFGSSMSRSKAARSSSEEKNPNITNGQRLAFQAKKGTGISVNKAIESVLESNPNMDYNEAYNATRDFLNSITSQNQLEKYLKDRAAEQNGTSYEDAEKQYWDGYEQYMREQYQDDMTDAEVEQLHSDFDQEKQDAQRLVDGLTEEEIDAIIKKDLSKLTEEDIRNIFDYEPTREKTENRSSDSNGKDKKIIPTKGEREQKLDSDIEAAQRELADARNEYAKKRREFENRYLGDLFGMKKESDMYGEKPEVKKEQVDKALKPYEDAVNLAKQSLKKLQDPKLREKARNLDQSQLSTQIDQEVDNASDQEVEQIYDEIHSKFESPESAHEELNPLEGNTHKPNPKVKKFTNSLLAAFNALTGAMKQKVSVEVISDKEAKEILGEGKPVKMMLGGKEVEVKPVGAEVVNGFYSPLEKTINESKQDKMPAKQWLEKFGKGEEAKWTGLQDWLSQQQGSVSKADIQKYLKENRVQIVEVVKGEPKEPFEGWTLNEIEQHLIDNMGATDEEVRAMSRQEMVDWAKENADFDYEEPSATKFSQYQLEGEKENYKEVLVTLPSRVKEVHTIKELNGKYYVISPFDEAVTSGISERKVAEERAKILDEKFSKNEQFKSSHFDEPNILAHLRMNVRTDAEGKKTLFIEEVQSDWGQKGKKEGFKGDYAYDEKKVDVKSDDGWNSIRIIYDGKEGEKINGYWEDKKDALEYAKARTKKQMGIFEENKGLPTAPFVTDTNAWTKLSLKVALKESIKQGEIMKRSAWEKMMTEKELWIEERMKKLGKLRIDCP